MIEKNKIGYGYNDLTILPAVISMIRSRSEVNPFTKDGNLPIFTAPMSSVVNCENFELWKMNGIIPILPRNIDFEKRIEYFKNFEWIAVSLSELNEIKILFDSNILPCIKDKKYKLCVDVANGNMIHLIKSCEQIKKAYSPFIEIMTGNIANPSTIKYYREAGIDYVRCSVGSGAGCTTTSNTAIHFPIATLIEECYWNKAGDKSLNIIADGGIRNYSDVIKALALGADYVMVGGLFASFLESAAEMRYNGTVEYKNQKHCFPFIPYTTAKNAWQSYLNNFKEQKQINYLEEEIEDSKLIHSYFMLDLWSTETSEETKQFLIKYVKNQRKFIQKEFFGMSTKTAQKLIKDSNNLKTSEGTSKQFTVQYTIKQWTENMIDYLRSAMSYCNSLSLDTFIGQQKLIVNSVNEKNSVNK